LVLKKIGLPVWIVKKCRHLRELEKFSKIGGKVVNDFGDIENDSDFKADQKKYNVFGGIQDHSGIVMGSFKSSSTKSRKKGVVSSFSEFKRKYPGMLVLGEATKKVVSKKAPSNRLFEEPEIENYKPKFKTYSTKGYSPELAKKIRKDFNGSKMFVIKPPNSARGHGVIMVEEENLDFELELIFSNKKLPEKYKNDPAYTYWKKRIGKMNFFIVEEFAWSKIIEVEGKSYDATMRVPFLIMHDSFLKQIKLVFLGAFWKLPYKSLGEKGSITDEHKSDSRPFVEVKGKSPWGAVVEQEDLDTVKALLVHVLPKVYIKMLQQYYSKP
jgi:hypothetical protein